MSWLDDIASKRQQEADTKAEILFQMKAQADRLDEMVVRLLGEVGQAYWGPFEKKYTVWSTRDLSLSLEADMSPSLGHYWEVREDNSNFHHYWRVTLERRSQGDFVFAVKDRSYTITTKDTSEAELKQALRAAIERGPLFWNKG